MKRKASEDLEEEGGGKRRKSPSPQIRLQAPFQAFDPAKRRAKKREALKKRLERYDESEEYNEILDAVRAYQEIFNENLLEDVNAPRPRDEITARRRRLGLQYHPDKYRPGNTNYEADLALGDTSQPELDMMELNAAYDTLMNFYKKRGYTQAVVQFRNEMRL